MALVSKVLIIYPPLVLPEHDRPSYTFPIGAGYVAAALEQAGYQVFCLDTIAEGKGDSRPVGRDLTQYGLGMDRIMERVRSLDPDAIGFSCQFSVQYTPTRDLIAAVRQWKKEVVTVIGGSHSSAQPTETLAETGVNYVVLAEGEKTVVELLGNLNNGKALTNINGLAWLEGDQVRINPTTRFDDDLDSVPFPARHLFKMEAYFDTPRGWGDDKNVRRLSLITSRGCPFECSFCGIHLNTGKKFRMRSALNVLTELDELVSTYGVTEVMFEDDNISLNRQRFIEILRGVIARNYGISWAATSGMALWTLDEEVLELMETSGCSSIYLGIESGNERVLRDVIRKHLTDKEEIRRRVAMVKRYGMSTVGFWVIGNPGETKKEMWDTLDFARELELDFNQVLIALPYRGTELYEICLQNGYFAVSPRLDPNQMLETKAMIRTPQFGPDEVLAIEQAGRFLAIRRKGVGLGQALQELFQRNGLSAFRILGEVARKRLGYYNR